ncbi:MAG: thiol oxidoreductase, partial [Hydrogenophilaceae bacterium]|nr:thiol oxidoreductase [Hydrogenophilaceae bacterium]
MIRPSGAHAMKPAHLAAALVLVWGTVQAVSTDEPADSLPGGDTTVHATGRNAFSFPAANLGDAERTRFVIGNSFFKRNWVEAPASTKKRDGLGPHFIARSCGGCHTEDGRGAPPSGEEQPVGLLLRLSVPGVGEHGGVLPEPVYGDQFDNFAVQGVRPEGRVVITHTEIRGHFADGTPYILRKPHYAFQDLGYGPMRPDVLVSPRIAPQLIGVGLIEAISEADILANAREQAAAGGPIKGKPNRVWDAPSRQMMLGRYGWKANVATIAHQTAGAFQGDIGITSSVFP